MTSVLPDATLSAWAHRSLAGLEAARDEINALNVFPVPDGDTGTNLTLTMAAACASLDEGGSLARGALLGARGNSGVIVSQWLRGLGEAQDLRGMLERASAAAYAAVADPVEGTILTVARAAAEAAAKLQHDDVVEIATSAALGAREALARTRDQLEALRLAGVVDAGGRGLVVMLDALVEVLTGSSLEPQTFPSASIVALPYGGPAFEVMYLIDADDVTELRERLATLGDSLVVAGAGGVWNVHVHVDDAGAAIEAGIELGRVHHISVSLLDDDDRALRTGRGVVVVTHGPGTAELARNAGAAVVSAVAQQRCSTQEILDGILSTGANEVIVLPSDTDNQHTARIAAEQARAQGMTVAVVPTRSIVQSLAALSVHDPDLRYEDDVVMMTRAAGAMHYGAVTIAVRDALTFVGACRAGDALGLVDGDIIEIADDLADAAISVLRRMLATGGELVTMVTGCDAEPGLIDAVTNMVSTEYSAVEVVVVDGGQPLWPLILGVE